jgi:pSer/pThr/pTyr-binding forkhead associated (FHA) protein/DNA-directed RNA polymerase subunit RPC12/RpoP
VTETLAAGTFVGSGSFRCATCGYTLTLSGLDSLTACPNCGGLRFARASLFNTERIDPSQRPVGGALTGGGEGDAEVAIARRQIEQPGDYLCYEEGGEVRVLALAREWTRIGRSLAADVRFDDPTVSRRHALIVRQADGVRVLDDRSLNGVFVNGTRVEGKVLSDGDEILVGRYRLTFLHVAEPAEVPLSGVDEGSLHPAG